MKQKVKMSPNYNVKGKNYRIKSWKWKWRDIRPSMVTHTQNLCSAFIPSKVHTHSSEHTHTHTHTVNTHTAVNTHTHTHREHTYGRSSGQPFFYVAAPGEQLGVWCLAQGHLSHGNEGEESAVHSLPPPTIPAGPRLKLTTFRLRVRLSNH